MALFRRILSKSSIKLVISNVGCFLLSIKDYLKELVVSNANVILDPAVGASLLIAHTFNKQLIRVPRVCPTRTQTSAISLAVLSAK